MKKESYANLTLVFSIIAALLALSAAAVDYARQGEIKVSLVAAAIFLLAFGFGAKSRITPDK